MSLRPAEIAPVPATTAQVAAAAFPKGCPAMRMRDELGAIYDDQMFASLYPARGQPAHSPWRLALVTVLQFAEGLPDRQAANAVRGRIDWKYALGLELADPGFDFSVLCEFRARLVASGLEQTLLDAMLARFRERGLLKARGRQRTDSTHVLAAVRAVNRLESVGETLRAALNALATAAPDWLAQHADAEWPDCYGRPFEEWRLPKGEAPRKVLGEVIGSDGHRLLAAIYDPSAPAWLRELPAVQTLRRAWVNQFSVEDERVIWRDRKDLPPASLRFDSPYDADARFGNKRSITWSGYKAHLTESCDEDCPLLVTHVETTPAPVSDAAMTAPVHEALRAKDLLPSTHLVDAGYVDADLLIDAQAEHGIELVGPVRPDTSWQAKAGQGYDISAFSIDWDAKAVTCPQGHKNVDWIPGHDRWGTAVVHIGFAKRACRACPSRPLCTRAKTAPREMTFRQPGRHEAIQAARQQQETPQWRALYGVRAGIEGCLSQDVRVCGMRRSRYVGLAKTHLQHLATAAALNVVRFDAWMRGRPRAATRTSRFVRLMAA
ncbi:MAG: IS1182 family transposase [Pseudomonadota bacterium]|nr:IS1182 family transposase [Pseudomonadota bacterium]